MTGLCCLCSYQLGIVPRRTHCFALAILLSHCNALLWGLASSSLMVSVHKGRPGQGKAGRQEHASSSVQLGTEPCRSPYCSTHRGIVWGQRKPQKLESHQRSLS